MYLPDELSNAHVLITVKTYPLPSSKYDELVCTAGVLPVVIIGIFYPPKKDAQQLSLF